MQHSYSENKSDNNQLHSTPQIVCKARKHIVKNPAINVHEIDFDMSDIIDVDHGYNQKCQAPRVSDVTNKCQG